MVSDREPDSDFSDGIGADRKILVALTDPMDFPSSGAFTVRLWFSKLQSTTIKISRLEAKALRDQLNTLAEEGTL